MCLENHSVRLSGGRKGKTKGSPETVVLELKKKKTKTKKCLCSIITAFLNFTVVSVQVATDKKLEP